VVGIGIDAVEIARFRAAIARRPGIVDRAFSLTERLDLAGRADPVPSLAARFAAKEAAMKAMGVGLGAVDLAELEIVRAPSGAPSLIVHGRAARLAEHLGVATFHVSLTHTETMASAVVVADA
jgi:holo-[acyl-carrier protein] synthase